MFSMLALGCEQVICTVVGSISLAPVMPMVVRAMLAMWFLTT